MMSGPTESFEKFHVLRDPIRLLKTVERKQDGLVISYALTAERDGPMAVRVRDPLPPESIIEDRGFHPEHQPRDWGTEDGDLLYDVEVPSDEEAYVVFGIVTSREVDISADLVEPAIESIAAMDADVSAGGSDREGAPVFRSGSLEDDAPESGGFRMGTSDRAGEATSEPDGAEAQDPGGPLGPSSESGDDGSGDFIIEPPSGTDVPGDSELDSGESADLEGPDRVPSGGDDGGEVSEEAAPADPFEEGSAADDEEGPGDGDAVAAKIDEAAMEWDVETAAEPGVNDPDGAPSEPGGAGSAVEAFLEALEREELSPDQLETVRERLGVKGSRALEVRVGHLESQLGNVSAYTAALEELINEHGDASTIISDIHDRLDHLRDDLDAQRKRVATAESERADDRNRLDDLEDSLVGVEERFDEELEQTESSLRERITHLNEEIDENGERLDSQDAELERVESAVTDDLAKVRTDLEAAAEEFDARLVEAREGRAELTSELEALSETSGDRMESIEERIGSIDDRIASMERAHQDRVERLEARIDSLEEMRGVFAEAFGPPEGVADEGGDADGDPAGAVEGEGDNEDQPPADGR